MTKAELAQLVDHVYALWNQTVAPTKQKEIYQAWFSMVGVFSYEACRTEVESLAVADTYMPRPGAVARGLYLKAAAQASDTPTFPPTALEAWATLRRMSEASSSGTSNPEYLHDCVRETIRLLGGTPALGLHTNADRNSFVEAYKQVVAKWEDKLIQKTKEALDAGKNGKTP